MKKIHNHLEAKDEVTGDAAGELEAVNSYLSIYCRRSRFNIGGGALPPAQPITGVTEWAKSALGKLPTLEFLDSYGTFKNQLDDVNSLFPPAIRKLVPPAAQVPFSRDDAIKLVMFWRAVAKHPPFALVGNAALRALSIPVSQTVVERSFSVLSNREIDNRLHAGSRYVRNMLMMAVNKPYLTAFLDQRSQALATMLKWS
jgi:hypothetical protein